MDRTVKIARLVMPGQTNRHGSLFGGVALSLMDEAAGMLGHRMAKGPVVTAHIQSVDFKAPIWEGWAVEVIASLRSIGNTSMCILVETFGEYLDTGERTHCTSAEFVMVAVDRKGRPRAIVKDEAPEDDVSDDPVPKDD